MEQQAAPSDGPSTNSQKETTDGRANAGDIRLNYPQPTVDGSDGRHDGPAYHLSTPTLLRGGPDGHNETPPSSPRRRSVERVTLNPEQWLRNEVINSDSDVQQLIRKISRDVSLSTVDKSHLCQAIHTHRFKQRREREEEQLKKDLEKEGRRISYSTVKDPQTAQLMLGCDHYPRNCKLRASCCNIWVVCRQCHDRDEMGHTMDRYATKEVLCMRCGLVQPVSKTCIGCHKDFARYYCDICKFFDNTPGKNIYHCHDCKICRVGKGIGVDNFHCKRCDACVSNDYAKNHKCLKKSLDANCPICGQYLFTSTKPVVFMRCGHTMHSHCFDAYTAEHYICPLCHKALTNMDPYYRQIDQELSRQEMPEEYKGKLSEVLCHDCDRRSVTTYHFFYLKCAHCGSYNTRPIKTFRPGEGSSGVASSSASTSTPTVVGASSSASVSGHTAMEGSSSGSVSFRTPMDVNMRECDSENENENENDKPERSDPLGIRLEQQTDENDVIMDDDT